MLSTTITTIINGIAIVPGKEKNEAHTNETTLLCVCFWYALPPQASTPHALYKMAW